ncbi:MAG TPA: DUF488 domain-containing protein [Coriobacteriia bacterium]|nr:DUF488 domain-containing protein [Coriobacteriia bacterium]
MYLSGDAEGGHARFREHLGNGAGAALNELVETVGSQTVALLCLERDPYRCHRSVIATMTVERLPGERAVVHL